jgi:hypothetical protein
MPVVEISNGELADKWTILQIKAALLTSPGQLNNLSIETSKLEPMVTILCENSEVRLLIIQLKETNLMIWNLMEKLYELNRQINSEYIELTHEITEFNQKRAFLKKEIDTVSQSLFTEAKSFFENPAFVLRKK